MNRPCIAIDVSKGSSHVCGFLGYKEKFKSVFVIKHDKSGFSELKKLYNELKGDTVPIFIFEATGIYHRPLRFYLEKMNYDFIESSPLLAAKHRKNSSIRSAKTDARDTQALSNLYYEVDLRKNVTNSEEYYELKQLHRYYLSLTSHLVKEKVHFNEKLDIIYPNFRKEVSNNLYKSYYLELLLLYPHPDMISKARIDGLENILKKNGIQKSRAKGQAIKIKEYSKNCFSGTSVDSSDVSILKDQIRDVQMYIKRRESIIEDMTDIGKNLPLYEQLLTIPGVGPVIAIRLLAELGDLSNFKSSKQLTAFAGLDPIIYQSGKFDGKGLKISKKGNKNLRTLLYQAVTTCVYLKTDNSIKSYFEKKKQTVPTQSAYIACSDKLLRIIFSMNRTGEIFKYQ